MSNEWYYAQDNRQFGPVPEAELRSLVRKGQLRPADLVWKEGMTDWIPVTEAAPLLDTALPPASGPSGQPIEVAAHPPRRDWAAWQAQLPPWLRRIPSGRSLLLAGLLLTIVARGCDSLGQRQVSRAKARFAVLEDRFNDTWDARRERLEAERKSILDQGAGQERLARVEQQLADLDKEWLASQDELRRGSWRTLSIRARDAAAEEQLAAYWRQWLFVLGAALLAVGLTGRAVGADEPAERWLCLALLGVLVWSLFVGGAAWQ